MRIVMTGIEATKKVLPTSFSLEQNYHNSLNPVTTIRYSLPHKPHVLLTVYNTLGQRVATLVQMQQEAGSYEVNFDGSAQASVVYFYRIQAGDFVATKRLLLLNNDFRMQISRPIGRASGYLRVPASHFQLKVNNCGVR